MVADETVGREQGRGLQGDRETILKGHSLPNEDAEHFDLILGALERLEYGVLYEPTVSLLLYHSLQ